MKTKSTVLKVAFTLILAVGFILPSCNTDDCNCPIINRFFNIEGLDVSIDEENGVDISSAIQWADFVGFLGYEATFYGDLNIEKKKSNFSNFSLMPTALACSCLWNGYGGSEEGIENLTFKTVYDYNDDYLAGSDISEIIRINLNSGNYSTVDNFIAENSTAIQEQFRRFKLESAPNERVAFQLEIEITLGNGEIYSTMTEEVQLSL